MTATRTMNGQTEVPDMLSLIINLSQLRKSSLNFGKTAPGLNNLFILLFQSKSHLLLLLGYKFTGHGNYLQDIYILGILIALQSYLKV